jgi:hypothetical protein
MFYAKHHIDINANAAINDRQTANQGGKQDSLEGDVFGRDMEHIAWSNTEGALLQRVRDKPTTACDADGESQYVTDAAAATRLHDKHAGAVAVLAQQRRNFGSNQRARGGGVNNGADRGYVATTHAQDEG